MKNKVILFAISMLIATHLHSFWNNFSDNPAYYANRNFSLLYFPALSWDVQFDNSLLSFKDFEMFEEDNVLSNSDKRKLTERDFDLYASIKGDLIRFGINNWEFYTRAYFYTEINLLSKEFARILFYGNEADKRYQLRNAEKTFSVSMLKTAINYGHNRPLQFRLFDEIDLNNHQLNSFINEFTSGQLYWGMNLNLYNPGFYADVIESSQEFGTFSDENYYNYRLHYVYSDDTTLSNTSQSFGFGFGLLAYFDNSSISLQIDDIGATLFFNDLAGGLYEGVYQDSLLYLKEDFEPFDQSSENDSLRVASREFTIKPALTIGAEYRIKPNLSSNIRYHYHSMEYQRGISVGVIYRPIDWFPLKIDIGRAKNNYYEFSTGIEHPRFSYLISTTLYNGFFHRTKGIGFKTGISFRI